MTPTWRQLRRQPLVVLAGITAVLLITRFLLPGRRGEDGPVPTVEQTGPGEYDNAALDIHGVPLQPVAAEPTHLIDFPPSKVIDCVSRLTLRRTTAFQGVAIGDLEEDVRAMVDGETEVERRDTFVQIFEQRVWNKGIQGDKLYLDIQASGLASNHYNTRPTVHILDAVMSLLKHKLDRKRLRILDIPCGDMVWMNEFLRNRTDIEQYTGLDIVPDLIFKHKTRYADQRNWSFAVHDIVKGPYAGQFDLVISRLLTQHLTNGDTLRALRHLTTGDASFLLITDYGYEAEKNKDIIDPEQLDRYRRQNLQVEPFYLRPPICSSRDSRVAGWLSLWKLPLYMVEGCRMGATVRRSRRNGQHFYHCA